MRSSSTKFSWVTPKYARTDELMKTSQKCWKALQSHRSDFIHSSYVNSPFGGAAFFHPGLYHPRKQAQYAVWWQKGVRWHCDSSRLWPQRHNRNGDQRLCCYPPSFWGRIAGTRDSLRSLTASVGLAATLSARMYIPRAVYLHDCRGRRGFAPNVFLFMFFPNCFIMPNLSSLEDASYHVQILFILLYWHRNNRCLIYIVIFSKRDVCIFWKCYNFSCFSMGFFGLWFCTAMYTKEGEFKCSLRHLTTRSQILVPC